MSARNAFDLRERVSGKLLRVAPACAKFSRSAQNINIYIYKGTQRKERKVDNFTLALLLFRLQTRLCDLISFGANRSESRKSSLRTQVARQKPDPRLTNWLVRNKARCCGNARRCFVTNLNPIASPPKQSALGKNASKEGTRRQRNASAKQSSSAFARSPIGGKQELSASLAPKPQQQQQQQQSKAKRKQFSSALFTILFKSSQVELSRVELN